MPGDTAQPQHTMPAVANTPINTGSSYSGRGASSASVLTPITGAKGSCRTQHGRALSQHYAVICVSAAVSLLLSVHQIDMRSCLGTLEHLDTEQTQLPLPRDLF